MKKIGFGALLVTLALLGATVSVPVSADTERAGVVQTQATGFTNVPVRGNTDEGYRFRGNYDIRRFVVREGSIESVGFLTGRVRDPDTGDLIGRVDDKRVRMPVTALQAPVSAQGTRCDILHLELGPLDLDILGLIVHVNKIVIDIDGDRGPGNLLGNLLCAIAGLLDPPASNEILARLLTAVAELLRLFQRL